MSANRAELNRTELSALRSAVRQLRRTMGDVTLARVEALLVVALEPGLSQREMMDRLDMSRAGVSSLVLNLTDEDALRRPGPGYVRQETDPNERRRNLLSVTAKGVDVLSRALDAAKRSRGRQAVDA